MHNPKFKSNYILDINSNIKNDISSEYINEIVSVFLSKFNISDFSYINPENQITYLDFKNRNIKFDYFYENIMFDALKYDNSVKVKTKVCVTFDKRVCDKLNVESGRYYNTLSVGGVDLVYFILFTLDEIYDFLYSRETSYVEEAKSNIADCDTDLTANSNKDIVKIDKIISENEHIKGYLDNHNLDKGLSFVSCSEDSGYPIYHRDFPNILQSQVGSILEVEIDYSTSKFGRVVEWHLSEDKEIEGLIQYFDGIFFRRSFHAYITTNLGDVKTIFVPSNIAMKFKEFSDIKVSCLARNKKPIQEDQYEWTALQVVEESSPL